MNPVLGALARAFGQSAAGRTGAGGRDVLRDAEALLRGAGAGDGRAREEAELALAAAERAGVIVLERHPRDPSILERVRVPLDREAAFFAHLGLASPTERRAALARQFASASDAAVPPRWAEGWRAWCLRLRDAALAGGPIEGFDRDATDENAEVLALLPRLLAWEGDSLVRFASCVLCGNSKRLESLAAAETDGEHAGQLRGRLGRWLASATGGAVASLDDLGITRMPRMATVHGPLVLRWGGRELDLGLLRGASQLSLEDIAGAGSVESGAGRVLTVENETTFHELAKLGSGVLLVRTSYPGAATVALLRRLPAGMERWHFGDSDAAGFEILRVLREKTGHDIRPLHMDASRPDPEQESLGRPRPAWPFY